MALNGDLSLVMDPSASVEDDTYDYEPIEATQSMKDWFIFARCLGTWLVFAATIVIMVRYRYSRCVLVVKNVMVEAPSLAGPRSSRACTPGARPLAPGGTAAP
jgi:hypothetical protein